MESVTIKTIVRLFNMLEILGIFLVLLLAFMFQFVFHELPCPLCLLQRVGFIAIMIGFLMNLRYGLRPSHYAMSLIGALFTSFVALRQIALHVVPGTGSYGSPLLGLHLYTWSYITSMLIIVVSTVMLGVDSQYNLLENIHTKNNRQTHVLFAITALFVIVNIITVLRICGLYECP